MVATPSHPELRLWVLILMALAVAPPATAQVMTGGVRGVVYDLDFDVPLAGVQVVLVEKNLTTRTSSSGDFVFENLPTGKYSLVFRKAGFQRKVLPDIIVTTGRMADLRVDLATEVIEMDEMIVTGTDLLAGTEMALLELRAAAVNLQDAISSELLKKAGVSDVAGALKLVVGASVVQGKYATVRGLSDRYTGTTLNGIRVPSSDPRRRAVQVDLFPTGTVESVTVMKTFTPDLQGDFTGGGVNIKTKTVPEGYELSISTGVEHDSLATGNDKFLSYEGGGAPSLGFSGADRALPASASTELPIPFGSIRYRPTTPDDQLAASRAYDALTRGFSPVIGTRREAPAPGRSFSVVSGNRFNAGEEGVLGVIGALTYNHKYSFYDEGVNNHVGVTTSDGSMSVLRPRKDSKGVDSVLLGGLGALFYKPHEDHEYSLTLIGNQGAEDEARFQVQDNGSTPELLQLIQNQSLHYRERTVGSLQLRGEHRFNDVLRIPSMSVDWSAAYNLTRQDEPDTRFFRNFWSYDVEDQRGTALFRTSGISPSQSTRRIFREIEEDGTVFLSNLRIPLVVLGNPEAELKLGAYIESTDRAYKQDSFYYDFPSRQCCRNPERAENRAIARWATTNPEGLWSDIFLDSSRIGLASNVDSPHVADNQLLWTITPLGNDVGYTGDQTISAFYGMVELPLGQRWQIAGGARFESTELAIVPTRRDGRLEVIEVQQTGDRAVVLVPAEEGLAEVVDKTWLPAISASYELSSEMKIRASYSHTIARPTFRELAPVATEEFLFGDEFVGNPELQISKITNYDLRWEWFYQPGEVLAFSVFYKDIADPIEFLSFGAAGRNFIQPVNFEQGSIFGFEAEGRVPLRLIADWLELFTFNANYTWIESEVIVPEEERASLAAFSLDQDKRRLLGQPDFLFNLGLSFDNQKTGTTASVFYNRGGETLVTGAARGDVETGGVPNVFQLPTDGLDLRISQKIGKRLALDVKARGLIGSDDETVFRTPTGAEEIKTLKASSTRYKVSLSWKW